MSHITLFHGSDHIVTSPTPHGGKVHSDYGPGFYTTKEYDLAGEWACRRGKDGFICQYMLHTDNLKVFDFCTDGCSILNWIAVLVANRTFNLSGEVGVAAKRFLLDNYLVDLSMYDIVMGYRADDSYFAFAEAFLNNSLSVSGLEKALKLGDLGIQYAIMSGKAFSHLTFTDAYSAKKEQFYPSFTQRDQNARALWSTSVKDKELSLSDVFILDLMRQRKRK